MSFGNHPYVTFSRGEVVGIKHNFLWLHREILQGFNDGFDCNESGFIGIISEIHCANTRKSKYFYQNYTCAVNSQAIKDFIE